MSCLSRLSMWQAWAHISHMTHKEPLENVKTMQKLAPPKCWEKSSWSQSGTVSNLPCSWLVAKESIQFPLQRGLVWNVECFQVFNTECVSSIFHCSHSFSSHPHVYQSALWWPLDLKRNKLICNRNKEKAH